MTLLAGRNYQFSINNADGDLNSVTGNVNYHYFWSPDFFESDDDFKAQSMPLSDGGVFVGEGHRQPRTVTLVGHYTYYYGSPGYDEYSNKHIMRFRELVQKIDQYRDTDLYIECEARYDSGSTGSTRRLFVKPLRQKWIPYEGTAYTAGMAKLTFLAADPDFYEASLTTGSASGSAGSASAYISNNVYATQRHTIKIECINSSSITNPTASSANQAGWYWTITDTLSGTGNYWLVDHHAGTVEKYISGVPTNMISSFSGSFFPLLGGVYNIIKASITSGTTNSLKLTLSARRKKDYV
jgi:hypothetical protein